MAKVGLFQNSTTAVSGRVTGNFLAIAAVAAAFYTLWRLAPHGATPAPTGASAVSWLFAAYGLLLLYGISIAISGSYNPTVMAIGADGLLSVSKFQFMLWNAALLFGYLWLMAARCYQQNLPYVPIDIPANLMLLTGFSVTTLAAAKAITVAYTNVGRISKPDNPPSGSIKYLATGDDGTTPDLVKIQMLVWTVIAVVVFLVQTSSSVHTPPSTAPNSLPDIGQAMMVLMGLGQAAYLGNKLTATDVPTLTSVQPPAQSAGQPVVVTGTNLYGNVTAYLDAIPVASVTVLASASSFSMTLPTQLPDVTSATTAMVTVSPGRTAQLSVSVDGVPSANALPILFK